MFSNAAAAAAPAAPTIDTASASPFAPAALQQAPETPPHWLLEPSATPRILYVASTRHSGGLEVASVRLAAQLMHAQPYRQEILFACRPKHYIDAECTRLGVPTESLTIRNSGDLSGVRHLIEIARRNHIDIIHVHSRRDYATAALAVAQMRREAADRQSSVPKLLLHLHLVRPLGSPVFLSGYVFAPLVDKVLAVSQTVRRNLLRCHPQLAPEQVVVVPNAVDTTKFRQIPEARASIRGEYGIPDSTPVIGMVGRLDAKGQEQVIRALAEPALRASRPYLLLVGDEGKPGALKKLMRRAKSCKADERVIVCGAQSQIASYLSAMDIFAHMPLDEAFGLAPAEAMAAGLPVVASDIGGCAELIEENRTGLLAPPLQHTIIAAQLARLVDNRSLRSQLGDAGALHVEIGYNSQVQLGALTGIYQEMIAMRKAN